jgi:hypothetical protein
MGEPLVYMHTVCHSRYSVRESISQDFIRVAQCIAETYQTEVDSTREAKVLRVRPDFCVREEECHCSNSTDYLDHR